MRRTIKQGPYYTESTKRNTDTNVKIFGEDQCNKQYGSKSAADFDPFTGVETYSMQYTRPKRTIPDLSTRILSELPSFHSFSLSKSNSKIKIKNLAD